MRLKRLLVKWSCIVIIIGVILSFQVQGKRRKGDKRKKEKIIMSSDLNYQLRSYSTHHVKIQESDYDWAKKLVNEYVNKAVWDYMSQNSEFPLRNLEYTGSQYEHLKTEAADEVDVMVIMEAKKHMTVEKVDEVPGWVKLRVHKVDSPFLKFTNPEGYILPEKMLSTWLFSVVTKTKNALVKNSPELPVSFEVRRHGPAVQLDITEISTGKKLSIDLVLSFGFDVNEFYVAKPYKIKKLKSLPCNKDILLRQSFSILEKAKLRDMDKMDHGCRHELLRIVKTIVRNDSALKGKLTTYHLKTAFLRYNQDESKDWHRNNLGERFLEYIQQLVNALKRKELPNFWLPRVNLLEGIDDVVINNMIGRLQRLLNSDNERSKILKVPASDLPALCKKAEEPSVKEDPGILDILRTFVADMGNSLSEIIKTSKDVFNKCVKDVILKRCKDRYPELISNFEYTGNLFESLLTEGRDDDDVVVLVILKKKSKDVTPILDQGYGQFKVEGSRYDQFSDTDGYVCPDKMRKWFFKTVREEAKKCERESGISIKISQPDKHSNMKLDIRLGQPTSQLQTASNLWVPKSSLTVNLVPSFEVERKFFVPLEPWHLKDHPDTAANSKWRQSFSMEVKAILQEMDIDSGCRHDLYKVLNTILKREPTFSILLPNMKILFVGYIKNSTKNWEKSKLGDRFEDYLIYLANLLKNKSVKHFWLKDVDLLSNVPYITLENIEKRVTRILKSEQERRKILKY